MNSITLILPVGAAAAGLAACLWAVRRPFVVLLTCVLVDVTNVSAVVPHRPGVSLYRLTFLVGIAAVVQILKAGAPRVQWSPVLSAGVVFLGIRALSILLAKDAQTAVVHVASSAEDFVFLGMLVVLFCASARYIEITRTLVLVVAALAGLSAIQEFVFHNSTSLGGFSNVPLQANLGGVTARHAGPLDDVNFWGRNLVLFVPLAISLAARPRYGRTSLVWLLAFALLGLGEYLTQSRGGLIAFGAAVTAWALVTGGRYARMLLLAPVVIVPLFLIPGLGTRLGTLGELRVAGQEGGDESLVGRAVAQRAAVRILHDHPALGVGPGNFVRVEEDYQREMDLIASRPLAPHNVYLEMGAESGLLGLSAWLLFFGSSIFAALRALALSKRLNRTGSRSDAEFLAIGLTSALVGWGVASAFLHLAYVRTLLIIIAMAAALDIEAQRRTAASERRASLQVAPTSKGE